jgi:PAS domain S-box-containing protein
MPGAGRTPVTRLASPIDLPSAAPVTDSWRQRLRLALPLLLLSVLIGAVGAFVYRSLADEIRRETHRTLTVIAEQKTQQLEDLLDEIRTDARVNFSTRSPAASLFAQWLDGGRRNARWLTDMQTAAREGVRVKGWQGMVVLDLSGQPVFRHGTADLAPHTALIAELLKRPRIELVGLHQTTQGPVQFGVLAPIGPDPKAPLGLAYLSWNAAETLYPLVSTWPVPTRTAETYLVQRDQAQVRFVTPLRHHPHTALNLTAPLDTPTLPAGRAAQGERGILSGGRDYRDVPVLAYASAVQGTPWLMLAEIDEREAYAGIRSMAWATAIVMSLGLLLAYSAVFHAWRRARQRQEVQTLQARQLAESRFRVIFEQAPLGVALVDSQTGFILEANRRLCDIIGVPADALIGIDPLRYTHPDDQALSQQHIGALKAGGKASHTFTKRYVRPDGTVVWASVTGAPIQVEADDARRHLFIVEDISERKRHERELREATEAAEAANAAKSEFLAHMSHEIRTPMNAVLGLAQVLAREPLPEHQRDMVARIRAAGQSLLALLNDVLDLSKIEAGQLRLEPRPFQLTQLLANLDSLMGQMARSKGITLRLVPPDAPVPPLLGDGLRLEQVLVNLIGNAIKFTEDGEVVVTVRVTPAPEAPDETLRLRCEVSDTGIGIAPEALSRLFAPFTQADGGIGRRFGGTGLGLSICKRLVELMGGEIGVRSEVGQGSTFWFELPMPGAHADALQGTDAASPPASQTALAIPAPSGPRLVGAQVLVVDDSAMNRDLVERALRLEGATATLAADGQQAVQILRTRPAGFDAVLMDVQMPVMDGLSATRVIREELGLTLLPIIAFTAGVRNDQQAAARAAGANDILPKPMDLEQMAVVLARWIVRPADASLTPQTSAAVAPVVHPTLIDTPPDPTMDLDFPDIFGIDGKRAAQRLGGDREMFIDLLKMFVAEYADAVARTRADLAAGERVQAARRMHTMRSSAGFLCALALMDAAGDVEDAIGADDESLEPALRLLERELLSLLDASAPWR